MKKIKNKQKIKVVKITTSQGAYDLIFPLLKNHIGKGNFYARSNRHGKRDWLEYCEWIFAEFSQSGMKDIGKFVQAFHSVKNIR